MALGNAVLADCSSCPRLSNLQCSRMIQEVASSLRISRPLDRQPLLRLWERRRTGLSGSVETKHQQAHFFAAEDLGH
jgi:hypothetical protein